VRHVIPAAMAVAVSTSGASAADPVRRVVIAQPDGTSIVASDEMGAPEDVAGAKRIWTASRNQEPWPWIIGT